MLLFYMSNLSIKYFCVYCMSVMAVQHQLTICCHFVGILQLFIAVFVLVYYLMVNFVSFWMYILDFL